MRNNTNKLIGSLLTLCLAIFSGCKESIVSDPLPEEQTQRTLSKASFSSPIYWAHYDNGGSTSVDDIFTGIIQVSGTGIDYIHNATLYYRPYDGFTPLQWTSISVNYYKTYNGKDYYKWNVNLGKNCTQVDYYVEFSSAGQTSNDGNTNSSYKLTNASSYSWYMGTAAVIIIDKPTSYFDWTYYGNVKLSSNDNFELLTKKGNGIVDNVKLNYFITGASGGIAINQSGNLTASPMSTLVNPRPSGNGTLQKWSSSGGDFLLTLNGNGADGSITFYAELDRLAGGGTSIYYDDNWGAYYAYGF